MAIHTTRKFDASEISQETHTVIFTRRTIGAAEVVHTLSTRCKALIINVPGQTDAGVAQANRVVRLGRAVGSTANGGAHIHVEQGNPYSAPNVEDAAIYLLRQGGVDIEVEILESLG